jgi:putative ABC transport system permease protein
MASFWRDLRFGLRMLARVPGHTFAAAMALGLGIGLTTAMFSILYGTVLRGLPYPHSERIMALDTQNVAHDLLNQAVDLHDFLDWRGRQRSFEGLGAFRNGTVTISGDGAPERLDGAAITANTLELLRVRPLLGRGFQPGDDRPGAPPIALLGYRLWQDRFNGDPRIVGKAVRINGQSTTVVGVMAADFRFPVFEQLWTPLVLDPGKSERGKGEPFPVLGRLRPGVSRDQATAEMAAIAGSLAAQYPRTNAGWGIGVTPFTDRVIGKPIRMLLYTMLGAVVCVLLIACINVASLIMSRATQRTREIAIRSSLGAGRGQVVRQILTESVILAALGAALGIALAWTGIHLFNDAIVARNPPSWIHIALDLPALAVALGATLAAGLASGLVPAIQTSRTPLGEILKDEGRTSTSLRLGWLSRTVVIAELAVSCTLLVAAGLMVKSVVLAQHARSGFDTAHLLAFRVPLFAANFPQPADRAAVYQKILDRLREQPGVLAAGAVTTIPSIDAGTDPFSVDGRAYATDADYPVAHSDVATAGFFAALGVRPLAGREIQPLDTATSQPVLVVDASLAKKIWPHQDPLGRRLRLENTGKSEPWRTVVGVVPDLRLYGVNDRHPEGLFLPLAQAGPIRFSYLVRTGGDPLALAPAMRGVVAAIDKDTPIYFVKTLDKAIEEDRFFNALFGTMFSIFGVCALALATVGIYGVIAFSVQRRTHEIGLRMALGAKRRDVLSMLLRQGGIQLAAGLALGLPAAFAASRLLAEVLFEVLPGDPAVFALVACSLGLVALVACLVPGQRAMHIDPIVALRAD